MAEDSAMESKIESQIVTSEVVEERSEDNRNVSTTQQVRVVEKRQIIVDMNGTSSKFM